MIGVSIIVFDGTNVLDRVIEHLSQVPDVVVRIVENQFSRDGKTKQPANDAERVQVARFKHRTEYENVIDTRPTVNYRDHAAKEAYQRIMEYQEWLLRGAELCLVQDADELYQPDEFIRAIETIRANKYDLTYCQLYTYYNQENYRAIEPDNLFVPFLCRPEKVLNYFPRIMPAEKMNVDPTRLLVNSGKNVHYFTHEELVMHHYSWVRDYPQGYRVKMENSTAKYGSNFRRIRVEEIPELVPGHNFPHWPQLIEV